MVQFLVLFSFYWFEFIVEHSSLSAYEISSSKTVHIETIRKFPNYEWNPHGITQNPNIKKQDVLDNPDLPWVYTDFMQDWVDEDWVESFPYYNERIVTKLNIIPTFLKQKINRGIPISHTNSLIDNYYFNIRKLKLEPIKQDVIRNNCKKLFNDLQYVFEKKLDSCIYIFGETHILFSFVKANKDKITFYFDKDTVFVKEMDQFYQRSIE
jgi:hypothetical protein